MYAVITTCLWKNEECLVSPGSVYPWLKEIKEREVDDAWGLHLRTHCFIIVLSFCKPEVAMAMLQPKPSTVKSRLTITSLIPIPCYYCHNPVYFAARLIRADSEIPTCIILYCFTPFLRPLKPVMFVFPLLILYVLIEVSFFLKIISAFRMLIKDSPVVKKCNTDMSVKTSLNLDHLWGLTGPASLIRSHPVLRPNFHGALVTVLTGFHRNISGQSPRIQSRSQGPLLPIPRSESLSLAPGDGKERTLGTRLPRIQAIQCKQDSKQRHLAEQVSL